MRWQLIVKKDQENPSNVALQRASVSKYWLRPVSEMPLHLERKSAATKVRLPKTMVAIVETIMAWL
jgi:hypothetical protein